MSEAIRPQMGPTLLFLLAAGTLGTAAASQAPAKVPSAEGLPANLVWVAGGKVNLGLTADQLFTLSDKLSGGNKRQREKILSQAISELGTATVAVSDFYLSRSEVTNEQYLAFVKATGHRFPLHWWQDGKPQEFEAAREKFLAEFGNQPNPHMPYWRKHWKELPHAIPKGKEQAPVQYVSFEDAQAFAAWVGMRLPTEEEWIYALVGSETSLYPGGDKAPSVPGRLVDAMGAFESRLGIRGLVGSLWEWVEADGLAPVAGRAAWDKEMLKLRKLPGADELLRNVELNFDGKRKLLKGGWFKGVAEANQFRVGTRAHIEPTDTVEAAGIRLAKSTFPGRDMARSRMKVGYDLSEFADRAPNLEDQVGMERYRLEDGGNRIVAYEAVSFVPANMMTEKKGDKPLGPERLLKATLEHPVILGTLVVSVPLHQPKLDAGIYTVSYRERGMPDELVAAIREAHKVAKSGKPKDEKKEEEEKKDDKKKPQGPDWRAILAKYGVSEDEASAAKSHDKVEEILLKDGNYKVNTKERVYLFRKDGRDYVAHLPTVFEPKVTTAYKGATLDLTLKDAREQARIGFGVPMAAGERNFLTGSLTLILAENPDASRPWRTPQGIATAKTENAQSQSNAPGTPPAKQSRG
ncbi:MAG: SUMF1/EgtB/PvdO family nonheme iron enzyme [Planctomycetes bacterium]|nr:SUMF1/EgtB/PvdO family nonheme iron enzyme [Planctomycetota bacterium]